MTDSDIDPDQCRAARAYLQWRRRELAGRAGVTEHTVMNFENRRELRHKVVRTKPQTRAKIRQAFEAAGLSFDCAGALVLPFGES